MELPLAQTRRGDPFVFRILETDPEVGRDWTSALRASLLSSFQAQLKFSALVCTGPVTSGPCLL